MCYDVSLWSWQIEYNLLLSSMNLLLEALLGLEIQYIYSSH